MRIAKKMVVSLTLLSFFIPIRAQADSRKTQSSGGLLWSMPSPTDVSALAVDRETDDIFIAGGNQIMGNKLARLSPDGKVAWTKPIGIKGDVEDVGTGGLAAGKGQIYVISNIRAGGLGEQSAFLS